MMGSRYISLLLSAVIILGPTTSFAQGFDFGSDASSDSTSTDTTAADAPAGDSAPSDNSGAIVFDTSDVNNNSGDEQVPDISIVAVPGPQMSPDKRSLIENEMISVLQNADYKFNPASSEAMITALQERGIDYCLLEQSCLSAVVRKQNIDELLYARLAPNPNGNGALSLSIDLFNAKSGLSEGSQKTNDLRSDTEIKDAIKPMLYRLFKIQEKRKVAAPPSKSIVSPIIAWSSLGLALGAAGAGAYFTYQAKTLDDKLKKQIEDKSITQVDAQKNNETIKEKQTVSFVFYGLAGGLAAVSTIFFFLNIGEDVSQDQDASIQNLHVTPLFSRDGAGLSTSFNF